MKLESFVVTLILSLSSCSQSRIIRHPLPPTIDLNKYEGCWYEIATIPMSVQKECTGTTASYYRLKDGRLSVLNRCHWKTLDGDVRSITGKATIVDETTKSRLMVQFDPWWGIFARGPYWILSVDKDYTTAVVGGPNPERLWLLHRSPTLDQGIYQEFVQEVAEMGYDTTKIVKTIQNPEGKSCGKD